MIVSCSKEGVTDMDLIEIERRLESGESLKVKYKYPAEASSSASGYGIRSDKLVDISRDLDRLYAKFQGETPIWIQSDEVLEILPDDGVYQDFPA